jgi:hypothetical protein
MWTLEESLASKHANNFPENNILYEEKAMLMMYINWANAILIDVDKVYYKLLQIFHKIMASEQQTNIASLIKVFQASFADRVSLYLALIYWLAIGYIL